MATEKPAKKNFLNWRKLLKKTARLARAGWKKMCKPFKQDDKLEKELIEKKIESLENNSTDKIASVFRSLVGLIPNFGSLASELISWLIPNQRIDRVCEFIKQLSRQVSKLEDSQKLWIKKLKTDKNNLLLFELSARYSMETNSNIKHHCYAEFIFNTIENKKLEDSRNEKLLRTLSELTEEEIILLISFSQPKVLGYTSEFDEKYEEIIMPKSRADHIPENDIHNAFRDEYILTLDQKGLITVALKNNGTKLPISTKDISITDYGSLLVESIYDEDFFGNVLR